MEATPRGLKRRESVESEGGANGEGASDVVGGCVAASAARADLDRRADAPTARSRSESAKRYGVGREKTLGIRNLSRLNDFEISNFDDVAAPWRLLD